MRPQFGEHYKTIEREGRKIFFVIDTSLSMLAEDGAVTRMDLAKYHVKQLLPKIDDDMISIIPFSNAYTYLPLTTDISAVDIFIDDIYVGMIGSSGTDITNALKHINDVTSKDSINMNTTIIIFSDGEFIFRSNHLKLINYLNQSRWIQLLLVLAAHKESRFH